MGILWLIAFLGLVTGGVFVCRWVYHKIIRTRWDKNDMTDIVD